MSDLREAAQAVLDRWDSPAWEWQKQGPTADLMAELRAALAQEQEQKQRLLEAVRVRIMQTAYDCADDGEIEAYNGVKVLCTEVLEMLK